MDSPTEQSHRIDANDFGDDTAGSFGQTPMGADVVAEQTGATLGSTPITPKVKTRRSTEEDRNKRYRKRLFCFGCNRPENHSIALSHRWFYSYLLGLTFGLTMIVGPFRCQCCGSKRLMNANFLNPRCWIQSARHKSLSRPKQRR